MKRGKFALYAIFVVIILSPAHTHLSHELFLSPLDALSLHLYALEPHFLLVLLGTHGAAHIHHGLRARLLGALNLNRNLLLLLLQVLLVGLLAEHCNKHNKRMSVII